MAQTLDPTTRLYRACNPNESLEPTDDRYVNCDEVRGAHVVEAFERCLRLADPEKPEVKPFAGHRGVGKTSELYRLRASLERPPSAQKPSSFQVVYFDVSQALDVNDLDFPDLLVCTVAEVQRQLRDANIEGFDPVTTYLQRLWDDVKQTLGTKVLLKEAKVAVPFGDLTAEIKNRPDARAQLREAVNLRSTDLLEAVNDLLTVARVKLLERGKDGLVLIIDGLDKMVRRELKDGKTTTHDRLFLDRADQLASLNAHTIYTVPISLFYSPRTAQVEHAFGEHNVPVSMINLRGPGRSDPTPETAGMKVMGKMIEARCRHAGVKVGDAFDAPETAHYLCAMTGGHPRHLMMFLRSSLGAIESLPITRKAAETAVRNYANSLLREIPDAYWEKLRAFAKPSEDMPSDELHQEMLYLLHVFEYMNGRPWYEVNPVIRTLPKYGAGS
ncbi:MAG: hypothetical protein P4L84_18725 [Isosphaeraceae bacterium]|nr:hypothetical protein [Isosphaeraceae bacterium]